MAELKDSRLGFFARRLRTTMVRLWMGIIVTAGLALGISAALLLWPRADRGDGYRPEPSAARVNVGMPGPLVEPPPVPSDPAVEPPTARAALETFLRAEADGRAEMAHALLTDDAKLSEGPAAAWQSSRPDRLVPVAFLVTGERSTADTVDFEVATTHTPVVSPFVGFVPARAQAVWRAHLQDGKWRVEPAPARVDPLLPPDVSAPGVARDWLERVAACDRAAAAPLQVSPGLYGPLDLLETPCQERGSWTTAAAVGLERGEDTRELIAAFGPDAGRFVRLVPSRGPRTNLMVAVAPLGENWRVLGVFTTAPSGRG